MPEQPALKRAAEREAYAELIAALDTARSDLVEALKADEWRLASRIRLGQDTTPLQRTIEAEVEWARYMEARENAAAAFREATG